MPKFALQIQIDSSQQQWNSGAVEQSQARLSYGLGGLLRYCLPYCAMSSPGSQKHNTSNQYYCYSLAWLCVYQNLVLTQKMFDPFKELPSFH